ncbi:MAG: LemA family protein [Flavobacteriales bacterium]
MLPIIIVVIVIIVMVFYAISLYNRIIKKKNTRENAFADVDVYLKQRYDMIPQLVETVKGYMNHEANTLIEVTKARNQYMAASTIDEKISAERTYSRSMRGFNIAIEDYPDLKANENFLKLQDDIKYMEDKIANGRTFFNKATREYNDAIETYPASSIAGMYGFKQEQMYDLGEDERARLDNAPEIKF